MRKSPIQICVLLVLLSLASAQAQFDFATNNGALTVIAYTGDDYNVAIPDSTNGMPVTDIGSYSFEFSAVGNVYIPDSITNIEDAAFLDSRQLNSVNIPGSVMRIGADAFYGCYNAWNFNIENGVKTIGSGAFYYCTGLGSIIIPDSVTSIEDSAFAECTYLSSVTIGNSVTNIGAGAFADSWYLGSITIPASVTSIGDGAFYDPGLGAAYFEGNAPPDDGAIFGGNSATPVSATVYYINGTTGWKATLSGQPVELWYTPFDLFTYMTNADSTVTITGYTGASGNMIVPNIIDGQPGNTNGLVVSGIGSNAFIGYTNLTSVTISNGIASIGSDAFADCFNLTAAYFAGNAPPDDGTAFTDSPTVIYYLLDAMGWGANFGAAVTALWNSSSSLFIYETNADNTITITSYIGPFGKVIIPGSINGLPVTGIGDYAFNNNNVLTSVMIPSSVTNIGVWAFSSCYGLSAVYFEGDAPPDDGLLFDYAPAIIIYYLPGTIGWSSSPDGISTVLWNPTLQTTDGSFGVKNNQFGFNLTGTTNIPVRLEAATNLNQSSWSPLFIGTLTNGSIYFSDPNWTNYPQRFYRVRSP